MNRFNRNYELTVTLLSGQVVQIVPEIRVVFEIQKSINMGLNTCKLQIYNLKQVNRENLVKDKEDNTRLPFEFKIGYSTQIKRIFKGTILESKTERKGMDFITTIESQDGGFDYKNSFTSKVVKSKDIDSIISDMPNTLKGKISKKLVYQRPKVLVGNSAKLIEDCLDEDETMFIDDETLNVVKRDEVISDYIPVVSSDTGLLNSPTRSNQQVNFSTLMNPEVRVGGLVQLISLYAPHLNGIYKVEQIKYKGDNYGTDWSMEIIGMKAQNYKVVK